MPNDSTSALERTDFGNLLGAPINACVEAQVQAAQATADYLDRVGFVYNPDTKVYETVTISFRYSTSEGEKRITLPLVSVMPIPYLQIRQVNLKFSADLSVGEQGRLTGKVSNAAVNPTGNSSSESQEVQQSTYSSELKVDVNILASSSDMPMGVAKLLQIMQQNIHVNSMDTNEKREGK